MNAPVGSTRLLQFLARVLLVAIVVFGVAVAASLLVDRVNAPAAVVDPGIASVDTTKHSRLLILHIDSWRYETAIDSAIMPQVAALRKQGASWQLETVFEGFTIPAVRAAFSGHAETQLVSLIQNFSFHALPIGSFFLDASRLGKRTLVVAQEPWVQFGPYFEQRVPPESDRDMYVRDHERPAIALKGYEKEGFDIVVCHYESADWVAHETGINSDRYRREFAYADSLVAHFAAVRAPNDYLLVYGDHGHSETGEHKTGIVIPTFALLLGPDVKAGVTTQPMAMTNLRYVVSHALGINLRAAPYDMAQLSRFLPVEGDTVVANRVAAQNVSRSVSDYALAVGVAVGAALLGLWLTGLAGGEKAAPAALAITLVVFVAELWLQQRVMPAFSVFPALLLGFAMVFTRQHWLSRTVVAAVGLWFLAQVVGVERLGLGLSRVPTDLRALIPLYTAAVIAKIFVLSGVAATVGAGTASSTNSTNSTNSATPAGGRWFAARGLSTGHWIAVLLWATALALLEFRVWDHPAACAIVVATGVAALFNSRNPATRRMAHIAIAQALLYFTLRLPLYQLAWIDLFLAAVLLVARDRDNIWVDMLIVTGTFTLTCGWLASSLEWGFLYTVFPAHLVELQVQYFGPFILAKIPLLLVLTYIVIGRTPTRRAVAVLFTYTALRFAAAWVLRLLGAPGAELWPLAEQGMYLAAFLVAAVAWSWQARTAITPARVNLAAS